MSARDEKEKKNYLKADIYFTRGGKKLAIIAHTKQIISIKPLVGV